MDTYYEFFHQYLQLSRCFVSRLNEKLAAYGMYHSQWMVLYYLQTIGSPSLLVEIANHMHVKKSSITRTVKRLEKRALVKTAPSRDKREKMIELTAAGREVYACCRPVVDEFEKNCMADLSEKEQQAALRAIGKIYANLNTKKAF